MTSYDIIMKREKENLLKIIEKTTDMATFAYNLIGDKELDKNTSVLSSILFTIIDSKKEHGVLSEMVKVMACETLAEKMISDGTYKPSEDKPITSFEDLFDALKTILN